MWQTKFARNNYLHCVAMAAQIRMNIIAGKWWVSGEYRPIELRQARDLLNTAREIRRRRYRPVN